MYSATAAPPPTPATQPNNHLASSSSAQADDLSRLLLRLPPSLSLPTRRRSQSQSNPVISLSDPKIDDLILDSGSKFGFFEVINHEIPPELALSAEKESISLFELTREEKESKFPTNWPLGFAAGDEDAGIGVAGAGGESFCLEASSGSLLGFGRVMEKLGLKIIGLLAKAVGFENPVGPGDEPEKFCSLMWISDGQGQGEDEPVMPGGFYPYIIGLQYQIRIRKYSVLSDSGWVLIAPQVDSVLVSVGDIAQVWSNGKLKKVRGRPVPCSENNSGRCISMSLVVTLPQDHNMNISPLLPKVEEENVEEDDQLEINKEKKMFDSFSFDAYAWRVYHDPLPLKDPLDRYRI